MSIQRALNAAIYTKIGGTATTAGTAVFYLNAPDNQALPYIIWDYVNEGDENDHGRRSKNVVVSIKAYAAKATDAGTIDGQIDTALHNVTISVTGWNNFLSRRENGYSTVNTDQAGIKTYMSGADYRFRFEK